MASTGAAVTGWSILGVGLLALGGALLVLARRRRLNRRDA
ncbi:LPXTG cell wall anchor domain-containing protein [Rothia kristinae]